MTMMLSLLDETTRREHGWRNRIHSLLLFGGIGAVLAAATWLLWGTIGVVVTFVGVVLIYGLGGRMPPEALMRLYRAQLVDPRSGGHLSAIVEVLSKRAELPAVPRLYVVPSLGLNAFATGTPGNAAIAVSEGLLRQVGLRELAGVLAHEISHIRNNDLWVMGLADIMTRITQSMSYVAVLLAILNLPGLLLGDAPYSWWAILLLYLSPAASSLLQLALSRTREYDADLEGALLTADPVGLASALRKVDNATGAFWEDMMLPVPARRVPVPSLLRTHPPTEERVARLMALDATHREEPRFERLTVVEVPMVSLAGWGPIEMRPRYRFPGVWF